MSTDVAQNQGSPFKEPSLSTKASIIGKLKSLNRSSLFNISKLASKTTIQGSDNANNYHVVDIPEAEDQPNLRSTLSSIPLFPKDESNSSNTDSQEGVAKPPDATNNLRYRQGHNDNMSPKLDQNLLKETPSDEDTKRRDARLTKYLQVGIAEFAASLTFIIPVGGLLLWTDHTKTNIPHKGAVKVILVSGGIACLASQAACVLNCIFSHIKPVPQYSIRLSLVCLVISIISINLAILAFFYCMI